jgi:hypothetical protein
MEELPDPAQDARVRTPTEMAMKYLANEFIELIFISD